MTDYAIAMCIEYLFMMLMARHLFILVLVPTIIEVFSNTVKITDLNQAEEEEKLISHWFVGWIFVVFDNSVENVDAGGSVNECNC